VLKNSSEAQNSSETHKHRNLRVQLDKQKKLMCATKAWLVSGAIPSSHGVTCSCFSFLL